MINVIKGIGSTNSGKFALSILCLFICLAIAAPYIVSDPTIIPAGAKPFTSPSDLFLFGTDQIGRDVFAGTIYGARWALIIGFLATFISAFIGVSIGLLAGYFGDSGLKLNVWLFCFLILVLVLASFYISYSNWSFNTKLKVLFLACVSQVYLFLYLFPKSPFIQSVVGQQELTIPIDFIIQRIIEIWRCVPDLFILLALLAAVQRPSLWTLILVLGVLRWTGIARLVRAELLHIREQNYIKSAQSLGFSNWHIITRHALPNALLPLFVVFAFSVSGAIILEATLSFLGIGVSAEAVTWGSLMSEARHNYRAWWLAVFPGMCIFLLLLSLNIIGDQLSKSQE